MHSADWLPLPDPHHPDLTAAITDALLAAPIVWLCGGTPRSRLALARTLAPPPTPLAVARLAGCRSIEDAVLCVGEAIAAPVPGSAVSVGAHLRQTDRSLVVLDDAHTLPAPRATLHHLAALAPHTRWLCLADVPDPNSEDPAVSLPPLGAGDEPPPTPALAWATLSAASPAAGLLLLLPAGLPLPLSLGTLAHPLPSGRIALRSDVAALLRAAGLPRLEASLEAMRLLDVLGNALALAEGGPLHADLRVADLLALRWLGEVLPHPDTAARATAAAARLLLAWGQLDGARKLLEASLRRDAQATPTARALLRWAEADTLLASGAESVASHRYNEAEDLLQEAQDTALQAILARRRADALAVRGHTEPAARAYRQARALARQRESTADAAAALRGTADLSAGCGELIAAEALYDQLEGLTIGPLEAASQAIGRAGLAIRQGALGQAAALLAVEDAPDEPLLILANRARRRADLALRQGHFAEAAQHARRAIAAYARAGERVSVGQTTRLLGDAAALGGQRHEAALHYQHAITLQIEVGDLRGLARTLSHAVALEADAQDPTYGDRLQALLHALQRA